MKAVGVRTRYTWGVLDPTDRRGVLMRGWLWAERRVMHGCVRFLLPASGRVGSACACPFPPAQRGVVPSRPAAVTPSEPGGSSAVLESDFGSLTCGTRGQAIHSVEGELAGCGRRRPRLPLPTLLT